MKTLINPLLEIESNYVPFTHFNGDSGVLSINGNAISGREHLNLFSLVILVDEYFMEQDRLVCNFHFNDFNSNMCKLLFNIFRSLKAHHINGKEIEINWFVEKDNPKVRDTGYDYAELFDIEINVQAA